MWHDPPPGPHVGRGPILARNVDDDGEILAIGFIDLEPADEFDFSADESVARGRPARER